MAVYPIKRLLGGMEQLRERGTQALDFFPLQIPEWKQLGDGVPRDPAPQGEFSWGKKKAFLGPMGGN